MSKLLDGLFPKTQRIDDIMAYNRQADKSNPGTAYNLLEDPEYVHDVVNALCLGLDFPPAGCRP